MKNNFRSSCPIASMLDIIGDKWSLLIIRDMLIQGKKTFKEFSSSKEGIAPGILSTRLKWLEKNELLTKRKLPANQKENVYLLTEKGIEMAPVIIEIIFWSGKHLRDQNPAIPSLEVIGLHQDKALVIDRFQDNYRQIIRETLS